MSSWSDEDFVNQVRDSLPDYWASRDECMEAVLKALRQLPVEIFQKFLDTYLKVD